MKLSLIVCCLFLAWATIPTEAAKQNWGNEPYAAITPGPFSALFVIEDKIESRKHYLRFVSIHQDKIAVHMAKEIKVETKNGKTRQVPWLKEPGLQSASHTTFADLGEKILVTQGQLIEKSGDGKELTIELPFADKTITYYCQRVFLGDKKK